MDLNKIEALVRPLVEKSGLHLYDIEFQGRTLRIIIEKPGGVGIDDCAETSRLLNPVLDVEDVVPGGRYELEVSSPGLDRHLRRPDHFANAIGTKITVSTAEPMSNWNEGAYYEKRRKLTGVLTGFDGTTLKLSSDGRESIVPYGAVTKAHVEFELKTTPKKGKKD